MSAVNVFLLAVYALAGLALFSLAGAAVALVELVRGRIRDRHSRVMLDSTLSRIRRQASARHYA